MRLLIFFTGILLVLSVSGKAQPSVQLDYFTKVPADIQNCGACYTEGTVSLEKKRYLLLTDFQNLGLIIVKGKQVKLQLVDTKTVDKTNILTYKGAGYTIILTTITSSHKGNRDIETGTLQIINGTAKRTINIHGQSGCDESKQEGNG